MVNGIKKTNMENINEMRNRHEKEIAELQKYCNHIEISDWIEVQYAPACSTGQYVKVCRFCDKVIEKKHPNIIGTDL